jgi:Spy/CpxP family protein refolding chaperone
VKARSHALIVIIAVFVFGCFLGVSAYHVWIQGSTEIKNGVMENRSPVRRGGRDRFAGNLEMTHEQQIQFREIMEESRRKLDVLRLEQEPKIEAIRTETNKKISSILDETQREQFKAFLNEMERRRSREPGEPGFGHPPDPKRKTNQRFDGPNGRDDYRDRMKPQERSQPQP